MPRAFRLFGHCFAVLLLIAGAASSAGLALGGATTDRALAWSLLSLATGFGMLFPGRGGRLHLLSALCVGGGAFVLLQVPTWLGGPLLLGLAFPTAILGRRLAWALGATHSAGLVLAAVLCTALLVQIGTGPWLYLLMLLGVAIPPRDGRAFEPPLPDRGGALALFMVALAGTTVVLALIPYWLTFDSGSTIQDIRRLVTVFALLWIGWATLGSGFHQSRHRAGVTAILLGIAAVGLAKGATTLGRFAEAEIFNSLVGWMPLLDFLGESSRLNETHWAWTPILTAVSAAMPLIALGAALRTAMGPREHGVPLPSATALVLSGAGAAVLLAWVLFTDSVAPHSLPLAFLALLVAAGVVGATGLRGGLRRSMVWVPAGAAVAVPLLWPGLPTQAPTGYPFFSYYQYAVASSQSGQRAEYHSASSISRVLDRGSSGLHGQYVVADGRNLVGAELEVEQNRRADALLPLFFVSQFHRALVVGAPHGGTHQVLREVGFDEIHWAVDPPALARVAWSFHPEWAGQRIDGLTASASRANGEFDYALVRDDAVWESHRAPFTPPQLRHLAHKLARGGVVAVAIDPQRWAPGLIGEIADCLTSATGQPARILLQPHGLQVPTVLIIARNQIPLQSDVLATGNRVQLTAALRATTHPLNPAVDLDLLTMTADRDRSGSFDALLAGPLDHLSLALSTTPPYPTEELLPWKRAARVIEALDPTITPPQDQRGLAAVLAGHLQAQTWALKDVQQIPMDRKIDIARSTVDELAHKAQEKPNSLVLQRVCESFAWLLVQQREVEWNLEFLTILVDECDWRSPPLLWAYGEVLNEMLEPEEARKLAEEALALQPGFELAEALLRKIDGEESGLEERHQHEGHVRH